MRELVRMAALVGGVGALMADNSVTIRAGYGSDKQPSRVQTAPNRSSVRLNRSRKWKYAGSYAEARAMSPFPERPVR